MASNTSSDKFMDELNDQFLVCKICFEHYKKPKTLSCLHTFCTDCLEKHLDAETERSYRYVMYSRTISCPICRKKTDVPNGGIRRLPDNFLVCNLTEIINRRKNKSKVPLCEICKSSHSNSGDAVSKCLDCVKMLCAKCVQLHRKTKVTQAHSLIDVEVEKDIQCKVHPDESVRFYCEPCEMCICVVCTFQEHKGHDVTSFTEGLAKYKSSLDTLLASCREKVSEVKMQLDMIGKCESELKRAEEQITDMAIACISAIRKRERQIADELRELYGEDTFEFLQQKPYLMETLENLQSTCNLTDIIVRDQSVELLLLKREMQDKLQMLLQNKVRTPPDNLTRKIKFVPGPMVFGYLNFVGAEGKPQYDVFGKCESKHSETQTDCVTLKHHGTSMGSSQKNFNQDILVQTDCTEASEMGTMTINAMSACQATNTVQPDTKDSQTMTGTTPVMPRKTQTKILEHADKSTETTLVCSDEQQANAYKVIPRDQSTITDQKTFVDQLTSTRDFAFYDEKAVETCISCEERGVGTCAILLKDSSMVTDGGSTADKCTFISHPEMVDKLTSMPTPSTENKETWTSHLETRDFGVGVHLPVGTDRATSCPRKAVLVDCGIGDSDVFKAQKLREVKMRHKGTCTAKVQVFDEGADVKISAPTCDIGTAIDEAKMAELRKEEYKDLSMQTDIVLGQSRHKLHLDVPRADSSTSMEKSVLIDIGTCTLPNSTNVMATNTIFIETMNNETNTDSTATVEHSTSTECVSVRDTGSDAFVQETQSQETITDCIPTCEHSTLTEPVASRDTGSDACKQETQNQETETEETTVFDFGTNTTHVELTTSGTCMESVSTKDQAINVRADMTEKATSTLIVERVDTQVETEQVERADTHTSMGSVVITKCMDSNTDRVQTAETGMMTRLITTENKGVKTDIIALVHMETNTISVGTADIGTATNQVNLVDSGTGTAVVSHTDMGTEMSKLEYVETGTEMPTYTSESKETNTTLVKTAEAETLTFVQTIEKATYMPQIVTLDTGTSTPLPITANKKVATDVQRSEATTMTQRADTTDSSTMMPQVAMVDRESDAYCVPVKDMAIMTQSAVVKDKETYTVQPMTIYGKDKNTMTHIETADVAVLKRPHTVTRGVGLTIRTKDKETLTSKRSMQDKCIMMQPLVHDRQVGTMMLETVSASTETDCIKVADAQTEIVSPTLVEKECSPLRTVVLDRGSSPVKMAYNHRSTSPFVHFMQDKCIYVKADVTEKETGMPQLHTTEQSTATIHQPTVDREVSPWHIENIDRSTSMPRVITTDTAMATVKVQTVETSTGMLQRLYTDKESTPIRFPTRTAEVLATVETSDKEASTLAIETTDTATSTKTIRTLEGSTSMPQIVTSEKETFTPQVHVLHKNVWTENKQMCDKCTNTIDVAAAYIGTVTAQGGCFKVNKGTGMKQAIMDTKETSPIRDLSSVTDKASSPVRIPTEDKGTEVGRCELVQARRPLTKKKRMVDEETMTLRVETRDESTFVPSLDIITEESNSSNSGSNCSSGPSDEENSSERDTSGTKPLNLQPVPVRSLFSPRREIESILTSRTPYSPKRDIEQGTFPARSPFSPKREMETVISPRSSASRSPTPRSPTRITHTERMWSPTPSGVGKLGNAFISKGSTPPVSIRCRVEMGTNTIEVPTKNKGTSTSVIDTIDRSTATESFVIEGKITECISKLRNVRQRLEGPHPRRVSSSPETPTPRETPVVTRSKSLGAELDRPDEAEPVPSPKMLKKNASLGKETKKSKDTKSRSQSQSQSQTKRQETKERLRPEQKQQLQQQKSKQQHQQSLHMVRGPPQQKQRQSQALPQTQEKTQSQLQQSKQHLLQAAKEALQQKQQQLQRQKQQQLQQQKQQQLLLQAKETQETLQQKQQQQKQHHILQATPEALKQEYEVQQQKQQQRQLAPAAHELLQPKQLQLTLENQQEKPQLGSFQQKHTQEKQPNQLPKQPHHPLARKQRLELSQLLSQPSVDSDRDSPLNVFQTPKLQVQPVQCQVIPKLNLDDFKHDKTRHRRSKSKSPRGGTRCSEFEEERHRRHSEGSAYLKSRKTRSNTLQEKAASAENLQTSDAQPLCTDTVQEEKLMCEGEHGSTPPPEDKHVVVLKPDPLPAEKAAVPAVRENENVVLKPAPALQEHSGTPPPSEREVLVVQPTPVRFDQVAPDFVHIEQAPVAPFTVKREQKGPSLQPPIHQTIAMHQPTTTQSQEGRQCPEDDQTHRKTIPPTCL